MDLNPDFRDLFKCFAAENVRFLVVGGYALILHAEPRFTKDLDVWVDATPANAKRVWRALSAFGAPLAEGAKLPWGGRKAALGTFVTFQLTQFRPRRAQARSRLNLAAPDSTPEIGHLRRLVS